jgi:hypothetical protein
MALSQEIKPYSKRTDLVLEYIQVLGQMSKNMSYFKFHETPYKQTDDPIARQILGYAPQQAVVRTTKKNYYTAIKGFDHIKKKPDNYKWELSIQYTERYISSYIKRTTPRYKDLYMDFTTGCGYPWNRFFNKKSEIPEEWIKMDLFGPIETYYWHLAMKKEKLPIKKILEKDKMRSFMMPSVTMLIWLKIFSQDFNEAMKEVPWSAYGFNWHNKGFDRIMRRLARHRWCVDYDISYWDKAFPLKEECYRIRRKFLDMTFEEEKIFSEITDMEINPIIVLPTGEVLQLDCGQCSGSENTTADNTLAHIMIIMYEAICGYEELHGEIPTLQDILANIEAAIYSDDNVSTYTDKYKFMADPIKKDKIFKQFGMAIEHDNPEKWNFSDHLVGHQFLGFTVKNYYGTYVPTYPYDKIKDSSIVLENNEGPQEQLNRFAALLELLTFTDNYDEYKDFIRQYSHLYPEMELPFLEDQMYKIAFELNEEGGGTK